MTQASNPSIERTRTGKPGRASHVKRWAALVEAKAIRKRA